MELTLEVRQSTIDAIKAYASEHGDPTQLISEYVSDSVELLLKHGDKARNLASFSLKPTTVQMLQGYAHLVGTSKEEAAIEVSESLSVVLETVLREKIAAVLGFKTGTQAPAPSGKIPRRHRQAPAAPAPTHQDTTGISDGLGDDDPDPEIPPAETAPEALVPPEGGLTDKDLDNDMAVEDVNTEAKADASSFGEMLIQGNGEAEDLFATEVGYVDPRVAKRKKGPTKSRGKVLLATDSVMAEGAGV